MSGAPVNPGTYAGAHEQAAFASRPSDVEG